MRDATPQRLVIGSATIEVTTTWEPRAGGVPIVAAHPADVFGPPTARMLADSSGADVVCVNPRGDADGLEAMADDLEAVRAHLGIDRWTFWGMSGGGWLAQLYARRYPTRVAGLVLESACACFRARLADPACAISPFHPAWRAHLTDAGLLDPRSHDQVGDPNDTEWIDVAGVGEVFRRLGGPALLASPMTLGPAMRRIMPALWSFDARPWLAELRMPALVVATTTDPVVPLAHMRALHEAIPGADLVVIEGAGHVPVSDPRPEIHGAVAAAVRRLLDAGAAT